MHILMLQLMGVYVFIPLIFTFCISSALLIIVNGKINMRVNYPEGRPWLCLPAIVTGALDVVVTLLGQPAAYWLSSYVVVDEANPIAHFFLTMHPVAFVWYNICELVIVSMLILALPRLLSKLISVFYTIGSAKAIYYWMVNPLHQGFLLSNLILCIPAIALVYSFEKVKS